MLVVMSEPITRLVALALTPDALLEITEIYRMWQICQCNLFVNTIWRIWTKISCPGETYMKYCVHLGPLLKAGYRGSYLGAQVNRFTVPSGISTSRKPIVLTKIVSRLVSRLVGANDARKQRQLWQWNLESYWSLKLNQRHIYWVFLQSTFVK